MPSYLQCRNCGRFVEESEAVHTYYCSTECSAQFSRCGNCGKYFARTESSDELFCSAECMTRYGEHEIAMQRG